MQQDIQQYYEARHPGEVVVLGADLFNCTPSSLGSFKQSTGATYPLLLISSINTGGNIQTLYGERDHYVVINKQGIVRYQANDHWPYSNGYHLDEIRGCVDSLVTPADARKTIPLRPQPARRPHEEAPSPSPGPDGAFPMGAVLRVESEPLRSTVTVVLANPLGRAATARVTLHDLAGRRVATLLDGPAAPGLTTLTWDGHGLDGRAATSGIYFVHAELGDLHFSRRIALLR